jgi:hypothetical protein
MTPPWAEALRYHFRASSLFFSTPQPISKIDFEFLASEPLARRLEAIAVNLHVV